MFHFQNLEKYVCAFILFLLLFVPFSVSADETAPLKKNIWSAAVGEGFLKETAVLGLSVGGAYGLAGLGSQQEHHFVPLISLSYGQMIGNVKGEGKWYRGNWEILAELFGGTQISPETCAIVGLTPHLRYNFATGTRFIPYVDVGIGVTLTGIREPDLGGAFQFNNQANVGFNYFAKDNLAINFAVQYMHISSASTSEPNNGVNAAGCFLGVNWFF